MTGDPWALEQGRLRLLVRLTPKSSRDGLVGIEHLSDGRRVVKARVRAVPEDGAANTALIKLVAKAAGVAPSQVTIASGPTARLKTLLIAGDPPAIRTALSAAVGGTRP
ncbi:DUF167 family protein [Chelatococcus reniformis]|uniref:DUF167 family protein n=1 Tax=Chelatococcus reniformis TaxID=1494448 RepID=UPI0016633758